MSDTRRDRGTDSVVAELRERLGDRLESVVLYGSVPRRESVLGMSDVNLLVILDVVSPGDLARIAPVARRWAESSGAVPMVFGAREFRRSVDAFAIEMADLKDRSEVLHGRDPVAEIEVPVAAMRHQLEHELRARHAQLREGLMLAAPRPASVGLLLERGLPACVCYLRAVLRLAGRSVPLGSEDVIRAAANVIGARPDALLDLWGARRAGSTVEVPVEDPLVAGTLALLERAIDWVDGLDRSEAG